MVILRHVKICIDEFLQHLRCFNVCDESVKDRARQMTVVRLSRDSMTICADATLTTASLSRGRFHFHRYGVYCRIWTLFVAYEEIVFDSCDHSFTLLPFSSVPAPPPLCPHRRPIGSDWWSTAEAPFGACIVGRILCWFATWYLHSAFTCWATRFYVVIWKPYRFITHYYDS